jgi:hypothetical protein
MAGLRLAIRAGELGRFVAEFRARRQVQEA